MPIEEYELPNRLREAQIRMHEVGNRPLPEIPNSSSSSENDYIYLPTTHSVPRESKAESNYRSCFCCIGCVFLMLIITLFALFLITQRTPLSSPKANSTVIEGYTREPQHILERTHVKDVIKPESCSPGYTFLKTTGYCYKITVRPSTFAKAINACEFDGGHLASVHSEMENDFIVTLYYRSLRSYQKEVDSNMRRKDVWIGLVMENGKWRWIDGTAVNYLNWAPGEPNLLDTEFWTVIVTYKNGVDDPDGNTWNNIVAENRAFVCKKKPSSCPPGYTLFQFTGYCYKMISEKYTFEAANVACKQDNAELASIHSEQENNFLADMTRIDNHVYENHRSRTSANEEVIIGLEFKNDKWQWTDGSPMDFTNWAVNEPNRMDLNEYVTTLVTSKTMDRNPDGNRWNNVDFSLAQRAFICKKPLL